MKAEHRKELETNALADRVGRVVQGMKQTSQKRTLIWLAVIAVVVIGYFLFQRRSQMREVESAQQWMQFADGSGSYLQEIIKQDPSSNQAKASEFEFTYAALRQYLQLLAAKPKDALTGLDNLEKRYQDMAKAVKDDKVLLPEALYAQAVIHEARIIKSDDNYKNALNAYKELADNHKESAFGKLARKRVEVMENKDKLNDLLNVYRDLRIVFMSQDQFPSLPPLPADHPPIAPDFPGVPK